MTVTLSGTLIELSEVPMHGLVFYDLLLNCGNERRYLRVHESEMPANLIMSGDVLEVTLVCDSVLSLRKSLPE